MSSPWNVFSTGFTPETCSEQPAQPERVDPASEPTLEEAQLALAIAREVYEAVVARPPEVARA